MTRHRFNELLGGIGTVGGWGIIVFLLGVPVVALTAVAVATVSSVKDATTKPSGPRAWTPSQADGPPVLLAIVNGEYARGDRDESLLADHPPDLILIGPSDSFYCYAGGQSKDVQEVIVIAKDGRLDIACVIAEKGRKGGLENPFAPLPLTVQRASEFPAFSRLEARRAMMALTGGGGVIFHHE